MLECWNKNSTAKTKIRYLLRHFVQCSLQTNGVTLQQTEKLKYLGVTFSSVGRQYNKLDTRIGKASAVIRQLCRSDVLKQDLCTRVKLSAFRSFFFLYSPMVIITEKVRSRVQAAKVGFVQKFNGLSLLDKVKSIDIR